MWDNFYNYLECSNITLFGSIDLLINYNYNFPGELIIFIDIYKNNATLYHMLSSADFPSYAYKENDSLIFRLEVPCSDTRIILSEIPDSTKKQIIYGYVEFKSGNYFASSGSADGQEILPRQKLRNNMKLYFKSSKFDF